MQAQRCNTSWLLFLTQCCLGRVASVVIGLALLAGAAWGQTPANDPALREFHSANGLLARGMDELAVTEYRKFLEASPNHEKAPTARYGLGVALFRLKRFDESAVELEKLAALDDFPFAAEARVLLGQCRMEQKSYGPAAESFQRVLDKHDKHDLADDAAALLTEALYRDGKFKQAIKPAERLVKSWPDSAHRERTEFFHGLSRMALKQYAEAAKVFENLQKRFPKGQFADQTMLLLAQSLHRAGSHDQAIACYQQVVRAATGELLAQGLYGLASLLQQAKRPEEAAALLDQLLEQFPRHAVAGSAQLQRGRIWFDQQQYEQAASAFTRAAELDQSLGDQASYWRAKCDLREGYFVLAANRLDDALKQYPDSELRAEMMYDRAVSLMKGGDSTSALSLLEQFSREYEAHDLAADAVYLRAAIEHERQRYDASQTLCAAFAERYGSHSLMPAVAFLAAENAFLSDQIDAAAKGYKQFLAKYPENEQAEKAKFRLGMALYRLEKFNEAQPLLAGSLSGRSTPEPFVGGLLCLADIQFRNRDWEQAAESFSDYLSFGLERPGADDAMMKLAIAQLRLGQADHALANCEQLLSKFPESVHHAQATFERAQILLERGELEAAAAGFAQVLDAGADSDGSRFAPYATNHLAMIAMRQQEYARAAELFDRVLQSGAAAELEPEAMFQRGQALMAARQYPQAAEALEKFAAKHADHPRVPHARAQRAIAIARTGEHLQAVNAIAQVEKQHASELDPSLLASMRYEKAWCLRELGRKDEAAAAYRELITSAGNEPVLAHALLELAELESAADRPKQAAELLTKLRALQEQNAAEIAPEVAERSLYGLAVSKFELEQYEDAAALCEQFIKAHGQSELLPSAHLFCGEAQFRLGKHRQAMPHFEQIVENFKTDSGYSQALLRLGECHAAAQQWERSEARFAEYLKQFGDSELWFQAQFGLAWAQENQGRHDQAMAGYREVIERHNGPTAARAQFQLGECLYAKKQYTDAVRELLKVDILYGYPEWSAAALYEAGRCFEELARSEEARAQFELVRQKYPETSWAKLAGQRLTAAGTPSSSGS